MLFRINYYKDADFVVSFVSSHLPVNYKGMAEVFGKFDYQKDEVFESLKMVKKRLRERIREQKLSTDDRYYRLCEVKDLTIESMVDELLDWEDTSNKRIAELETVIEGLNKIQVKGGGQELVIAERIIK